MLDIVSFILGLKKGKSNVELDTDAYTFTDDGEGNITITEATTEGENNG